MTDRDRATDSTWSATTMPGGEAWAEVGIGLGATMGRYQLVSLVGSGGMGVVFAARDPELDRTVAVKILRAASSGGGVSEARLKREGQTMARLTHPNVIRVYDVGIAHGHAFVAMEFVEGGTLQDWLDRRARTPDEIVVTFVQAGRGIAAAHGAGLVHRDFKPQNVLVGGDGRVLVTDFGLARDVDGPATDPGDTVPAVGTPTLTRTGQVVGTPAYMAPEQYKRGAVDARADQFSFCVALWRALYGVAPFRGDSAEDLAASTARGSIVTPPPEAAARVPAAIRAALERGLRSDPAERFGSMHELLAAIQPRASPVRAWWWAAGAGGIAVAGALALSLTGPGDPCPEPDADVAKVWGGARRGAVRARVAALDPGQADARFGAVTRAIDPYVASWRDMHVQACEATRVRGAQSDTLLDARMRCLGIRLGELDTSIALVVSAKDAEELAGALHGLTGLTPVARCADLAAMERDSALPPVRGARATADELTRRIQRVEAAVRAHRLVGVPELAVQVVADARAFGHPPTLVGALVALAQVQLAVEDTAAAATTLRELTQVAARARDDRAEAFAWSSLVGVVGGSGAKPDEALALVPAASAALLRAGEPVELRAELLYAQALVLDEGPRVAEGLAKLGEARALLEQAGAAAPGSPHARRLADVLLEVANAHHVAGDHAAAVASYRAAIDHVRTIYGPDSIDEAIALHDIGEAHRRAGQLDPALAAYEDAARIELARTGQSARYASTKVSIAAVYGNKNDYARALATYDEALALYRKLVGNDDIKLVPAMTGRASELDHLDRPEEADRAFEELIALIDRTKVTTLNLPIALYNRGEMRTRRKRCGDAIADYRRSAEQFAAQRGEKTSFLLYPLVGAGRCHVVLGKPADAIAPLQRATELGAAGGDELQIAKAHAWLGRALYESGRDRKGGIAMAKRGREMIAKSTDADGPGELAVIDRWLAARGVKP